MNTRRFLKCFWPFFNIMHEWVNFVRNKAKGRISKQVLQENKARQIFSDICFSENLTSFVFQQHPFRSSAFCYGRFCFLAFYSSFHNCKDSESQFEYFYFFFSTLSDDFSKRSRKLISNFYQFMTFFSLKPMSQLYCRKKDNTTSLSSAYKFLKNLLVKRIPYQATLSD